MSSAMLAQLGNLGPAGALLGGGLGLKSPADLTIALVKSRTLEDGLIEQFQLMKLYNTKKISDARKDLEKQIHTSDLNSPDFMQACSPDVFTRNSLRNLERMS